MADETDTDGEEQNDMTFAEMMDYATDRIDSELDGFNGDVPDHAGGLVNADAGNLMGTIMNVKMALASEDADDPSEEMIAEAIEEDAVNIIMSLGALQREYNLDIAAAFQERIELINDFEEFEEAMSAADSHGEEMDAIEEYMGEEAEGMFGPEVGSDVSMDDYNPDDPDRHIQ